jgi:signal transduction histidine kinase
VDAVESPGRLPLSRRRLALFLFVFLVPFGVLTMLAVRTISQDRELSVRRLEDERRQLAAAIRQELIGRLENLELRVLSGAADGRRDDRAPDAADAVVLMARIEGRRLVLPWESKTAAADVRHILAERPFADLIASGELEEFGHQRLAAAASFYRRALSSARHPMQAASAELLVARALGKAGQAAEALGYSRSSLRRPLSIVDEQGVPFALYAARRVADLHGLQADDARAAIEAARQAGQVLWASPAAVNMAAVVVSKIRSSGPPEIKALASVAQQTISAAIARTEQALALQQTFPALVGQFPSPASRVSDHLWLPFGQGPWLISLTVDISSHQPILLAIDAVKAFDHLESAARCSAAGGCHLALAAAAERGDFPLGSALPGLTLLHVTSGAEDESRRWFPKQGFYIGALSLVLVLAAFGAFLLWRDVRRELHVAEMRSQFVSSVSHELKTPLTAIRMFAETLRMDRPAEPALRNEYLDIIVDESERLTRLLNNVLDFSRIESGRKNYNFAPHDLASIVRTAARAMRYPLAQQGFELLVNIDEGIPTVRCDADAVEQAILNLLANALKYSGNARKIELSLARDGPHAVISVRDWGIGIEPVDQRRIFEKFHRVVSQENRLIPGTGLGLTLVDHIVRAHHGLVDVESTPSAGSTFRIHLPFADSAASADEGVMEPARQRPAESEA